MNQQFGMVQQMIDVQKASVDGLINGFIMMWEQTGIFFDGAIWLPEEGRKVFRQWVEINKKACEDLKGAMGGGYSHLEKVSETMVEETQHAVSRKTAVPKAQIDDPMKAAGAEN